MLVLGGREFILVRKKQCWFGLYQQNWLGVYVRTPLPGIFVTVFFELHICTVARTLDRLEEPQPLLDSSGSRWRSAQFTPLRKCHSMWCLYIPDERLLQPELHNYD